MSKRLIKEVDNFIDRIVDNNIIKRGESLIICFGKAPDFNIASILPPENKEANACLFLHGAKILDYVSDDISQDCYPDDDGKREEMRKSTCKKISDIVLEREVDDGES